MTIRKPPLEVASTALAKKEFDKQPTTATARGTTHISAQCRYHLRSGFPFSLSLFHQFTAKKEDFHPVTVIFH